MTKKRVFINTMGCQMNVYDSDQILNRLAPYGYTPTDDLALADLIIVNSCSIRAKAEQKAFSFLGRLAPIKERRPQVIIGIGGCVAQQEGRAILRRMPHVDMVFGTQAIPRLPKIIKRISDTHCRIVDVTISESLGTDDYTAGSFPEAQVSAFVTIMRGCDNYCSYCIVPHVRGREVSRPPEEIISEIRHLVSAGVREVTLLGQNVNSYGQKEHWEGFADLLTLVNDVQGLQRIRFTTSHPKDLTRKLMKAFGRLEKVCNHIHLPVQSGSDQVLKRMNRRYSRNQYLNKVSDLRQLCPGVAISSDIIVGFPGETEEDFERTLSLVRTVEFDSLFVFFYSDRPNAPSVHFKGKIEEKVMKDRLQAVLATQEEITQNKNQRLVGTIQRVLVDGPSKTQSGTKKEHAAGQNQTEIQWSGRTETNKIVHFLSHRNHPERNQVLTGCMMDIMIERVMPHSLWGHPIPQPEGASRKGDQKYAA